ncbi:TPA: dihydrolipoyl dehydrogenase [Candidatus Woesearchaeota archaeon]|nr:dihydrolipoyl dehydrogenase [Candidatus Woesearchaeota archaeon]
MKTFDLIVIGAGSGLDAAVEAAQRGWKVALVEEGPLGGTCLNRGCIPSKMIIHAAEVAQEIQNAKKFGLTASLQHVNLKQVTQRASVTVDHDARSIEQALRSGKNPTLFKGRGTFISSRTLQVNKEIIIGKRILIAAGARPSIPSIPGLDTVPYWTSTDALRQTVLPKSLIVIGGGYIAAELGNFYGTLGCKVTLIQRGQALLSREDKDIVEKFTSLWKKKYTVLLNTTTDKVEKKGKNIVVTVSTGKKVQKITAEKILVATGIKPNSDLLNLEKTGVKVNQNGFIQVNQFLETSAQSIWALGDIAGVYLFKHSANLEAEYLVNNLFGIKKPVDYYPMPHAIFTDPQVAGVGLTEQEAMEQKKKYVVGRYEYKNTGMGAAMEEKNGFVKFIVEAKTKEILGCHILGPQASTLLHEVVVAMKADRFKALDILRSAVHVHPALSEVVQRAARSVKV